MRLKRVRIFGFKTFADKTEFELPGGLVAVVGSNGCGKSNLVDAILWGLGEGSARQLRAVTSQDVIFGGSPKRKALGYCEVTLLFDNEDGMLPVETPEVSITRRLNRAGESEYSINRQSCRLRDIHELLADSGLGRSGYAIVGQKEIDQALAASADERRAWVDEAAGIQRYRARKTESLRKLNQAHGHLERVDDILRELESQREPLRDEAEVALRYRSVMGALREVELGMLVEEVAKAVDEAVELERRIGESGKLIQAELKRADELDAEMSRAGETISGIEREMDSVRGLQQGSLTAWERADAGARLALQKLQSLDELERSLQSDDTGPERIEESQREREQAHQELEREAIALLELRKSLDGASQEAADLRKTIDGLDAELLAGRANEEKRLKRAAEAAHRADRLKLARREREGAISSLPDLDTAIAEAQTAFDEAAEAEQAVRQRIEQGEQEVLRTRKEEDTDAQTVRRAISERASLEGRKRGIEHTLEAHEGVPQGTRAVLEARERGLLRADYWLVGQTLETDRDLALAIETALGASAHDLIVVSDQDAKEAIAFLKEHRAGRATFQPLPFMRPTEPSMELRRMLGERGVVGRASELVSTEVRFRPVIDSLLGRVVIVETIDDALRLAKTTGWSRLVTLDGEVVHSAGAVTGGRQAKAGYGVVQRKADLAEIDEQLAVLERTVREFEGRSAKRMRAIAEIEASVSAARQALTGATRASREARDYLHTLSEERKSAQREVDRLDREIGQLTSATDEAEAPIDLAAIEARRDAVLRDLASRSAEADGAQAMLRTAELRRDQAHARLEAAERRLKLVAEAEMSREKKLAAIEPDRERARQERAQAERMKAEAEAQKTAAASRLEEFQSRRRELLEKNLALVEEAKAARANATSLGDASHQAEVSRARLDARRAATVQRLMDDYGVTEDDALDQRGVHAVPDDAVTVVNRLRREVKAMGEVNLGAIEAFDRLTVRLDELGAQREDALGSIHQIEASIRELDKLSRDRFATTFAKVQTAYAANYEKLFGGGEGSLVLTNPDDVLESGIEIDVTLPGKKRQRLELLSGGERALCATAFLFALLETKPSPLVVLDEVDAPLDGRNVERFADLLLEFGERMQFIIVSHNTSTIARAPVWLGVTMQEPGISMLIPARRPENKQTIEEFAAL